MNRTFQVIKMWTNAFPILAKMGQPASTEWTAMLVIVLRVTGSSKRNVYSQKSLAVLIGNFSEIGYESGSRQIKPELGKN